MPTVNTGSTTTTAPAAGTDGTDGASLAARPARRQRGGQGRGDASARRRRPRPSKDGAYVYTLAPSSHWHALSKAEAALNEEWAVNVSVKNGRKKEANAAFNACYNNDPCAWRRRPQQREGHGSIADRCPRRTGAVGAGGERPDLAVQHHDLGNFTQAEAKELALVLRYGSLPVEFEQAALQQVSATLGRDSLHAGLLAGLVGIAVVAIYMLAYYRGLGLVVVAGLSVWAGLMYGLICALSANAGLALTLSGIIGIVVSVGTTVDSYVVYFERMKDEVKSGRSVKAASERGFDSAIRTIITADVASFLGAFLLYILTVGPVRGFAFFLGISVLLDLFVAYFFTRPLVMLIGRSPKIGESRFFGLSQMRDPQPPAKVAPQTGAAS
ncbi:MAG: SecD/SecF family protein translocase subunit [Acidimicrobiales bacterium]